LQTIEPPHIIGIGGAITQIEQLSLVFCLRLYPVQPFSCEQDDDRTIRSFTQQQVFRIPGHGFFWKYKGKSMGVGAEIIGFVEAPYYNEDN
jgi:hypothetical protein